MYVVNLWSGPIFEPSLELFLKRKQLQKSLSVSDKYIQVITYQDTLSMSHALRAAVIYQYFVLLVSQVVVVQSRASTKKL